jgi:hypothetical protein
MRAAFVRRAWGRACLGSVCVWHRMNPPFAPPPPNPPRAQRCMLANDIRLIERRQAPLTHCALAHMGARDGVPHWLGTSTSGAPFFTCTVNTPRSTVVHAPVNTEHSRVPSAYGWYSILTDSLRAPSSCGRARR